MDDARALLGQYLEALTDPTRASILFELEGAGELTATQIARRLGLTVNNVYHHIRVLNRLGVLAEPRVVPGPSYVEKYYRVQGALTEPLDPTWYDEASRERTMAQQQLQWCAFCAHLGQVFLQAAQRYAALAPEEWEKTVLGDWAGMLSRRDLARDRYLGDLEKIRAVVNQPGPEAPDRGNIMIVAALPELMRLLPAAEPPAKLPATAKRRAGREPKPGGGR